VTAVGRDGQLGWAFVFLVGLLQDGDRKSVEPLVDRVLWLPECQVNDPVQSAWYWLNKGAWSDQEALQIYRRHMREQCDGDDSVIIFDDTSFVKKGDHSVGVAHQYCGSLGKQANCQVAVSLHYLTRAGHYPLAMRLHLPESWTETPERLQTARVPEEHRVYKTKHQIALELLDQVLAEGHQARSVTADAGYGSSESFRAALDERGLTYAVGVRAESVAFVNAPTWLLPGDPSLPNNQKNPRLAPGNPRPEPLEKIAPRLAFRQITWREGTKGELRGEFARCRVWPAKDWQDGKCWKTPPVWLVVERRGKELRYHFSNLPSSTPFIQLIRLLKKRWPVEQGYQQLKEELGIDHFEGRSWVGFHHHICMAILAYGFLELERQRLRKRSSDCRTKKKVHQDSRHCQPSGARYSGSFSTRS
jgi:SRSO17 transposase